MAHISTQEGLTVRDDVLIEIATFLSRRWSDKARALVTFTEEPNPKTSPDKGLIALLIFVGMLEIDFKSIVSGVYLCGTRIDETKVPPRRYLVTTMPLGSCLMHSKKNESNR